MKSFVRFSIDVDTQRLYNVVVAPVVLGTNLLELDKVGRDPADGFVTLSKLGVVE